MRLKLVPPRALHRQRGDDRLRARASRDADRLPGATSTATRAADDDRDDVVTLLRAAGLPSLRRGSRGDSLELRRTAPASSCARSTSRPTTAAPRDARADPGGRGRRRESSASWSSTPDARPARRLDTLSGVSATAQHRSGGRGGCRRGARDDGRAPLARRRGAPLALPPGPDPGAQDGQGDDLLPGARRLHAHQLDPDPPRPLGLRQVRQARASATTSIRSSARSARSCGPRASTTSRCSVPATSARRSPAPTSSPTTASAIVAIFDVAPKLVGKQVGGCRSATLDELEQRRRRGGVVVGVLAVPPRPPRRSPTASSRPASRSSSTTPSSCSQVPPEVTVHTSSPAVDLLYALYFYLA